MDRFVRLGVALLVFCLLMALFVFGLLSLLFFLVRARCLSAGLRYLRLTRLPRHDRGPVPGGNRSAASCLCTVLRRALYHYATRSPFWTPLASPLSLRLSGLLTRRTLCIWPKNGYQTNRTMQCVARTSARKRKMRKMLF